MTGEAGLMRLMSGRVRIPDVAFISFDRLPNREVPAEPVPRMTPDLAVEILSDNNTSAEINQKLREYFESGTRLAWVIDADARTVAIYREAGTVAQQLGAADMLYGETVLPGFAIPVASLFKNLPPTRSGK